jgi:DNA polymerase III epsilon subunit family exonuclease
MIPVRQEGRHKPGIGVEQLPLADCVFVAFDLETTGLYAHRHRIVELGAVRFRMDGTELGRYSQLVNPGRRMPPDATAVNGITDAMLRHQPSLGNVLPEFLKFCGPPQTILIAHNASFDLGFLRRAMAELALPPLAHRVVDTLLLAQVVLPGWRNYKLETLAAALGAVPPQHRSLGDALAVMHVFRELVRCAAGRLTEKTLMCQASCLSETY